MVRVFKREDGQSLVMVVFILAVLIALVALVLDIGNAYAQRRVAQNAADASAMAATRELARGVQSTTNRQVLNEAKDYAQINGIDPATLTATYFSFDPDTRTKTDLGVVPNTTTRPPENANGVNVVLGKTFNTYLAPVIGHDFLAASAESYGLISLGACAAGGGQGLFPIAFNVALFDNERDHGKPTVGASYHIWYKDPELPEYDVDLPGNFGWITWDGDPSNDTLVKNMNDTTRSPKYTLPEDGDGFQLWIGGGPGVMNSGPVRQALNVRIANTDPQRPKKVLLPVFDVVQGEGHNGAYHIIGFAWFTIEAYNFQGNDKWIEGYFSEDNVPDSEGGCEDFGTKIVKLRPPMDLTRNIAGTVAYEHLKPSGVVVERAVPVDVVSVLDVSGSMNDSWGSGASYEQKIVTARDVLVEFNNMLHPELGDQAGLVKYPVGPSTVSSYYKSCGGTSTQSYGAQIVQNLTSDIGAVNASIQNLQADGWTPLATAMRKGFEAVSDPAFHKEGNTQIVILASDGMGNVMLNGKLTGWDGRSPTEPVCNTPASADAIDMANMAKSSGVTLFTVGIGDFLTYVLEAMATPDTDPQYPHFLHATNPDELQSIYDSLGERINKFNECILVSEDASAANALVTLYKDGAQVAQTRADAAGKFIFNGVEPGTYRFSATVTRDGVTYDVFTNKVGGVELDSAPELVVEASAGTYSINLALKTANPPQCNL